MQDIIVSVIPALIIAGVTALVAYFTIKRSMKQFYSQRWWERKADKYNQIIEILSDLEFCYIEEVEEREGLIAIAITPKDREKSKERYRKAYESIMRTIAISAYIVSDDTAKALSKLLYKLQEIGAKEDWFSKMKRSAALVKECIAEIKYYAKKDLMIK